MWNIRIAKLKYVKKAEVCFFQRFVNYNVFYSWHNFTQMFLSISRPALSRRITTPAWSLDQAVRQVFDKPTKGCIRNSVTYSGIGEVLRGIIVSPNSNLSQTTWIVPVEEDHRLWSGLSPCRRASNRGTRESEALGYLTVPFASCAGARER